MKTLFFLTLFTLQVFFCTSDVYLVTIDCGHYCNCYDKYIKYILSAYTKHDNSTSYSEDDDGDSFYNMTTFSSHYETQADCRSRNMTEVITDLLSNATEVLLSHNRITSLPGKMFANYPKMSSLDLRYNSISHVDKDAFFGLSHLSSLRLSHNKLAFITTPIFDHLLRLNYLDIGYNDYKHVPFLKSLVELKELSLAGNKLEDIDIDFLPDLTQLFSINLRSNKLRYFPKSLALYLENNTQSDSFVAVNGNPWVCDCFILSLKAIWPQHPRFLADSIYCEQPKLLLGENIWNVPNSEFVCNNETIIIPNVSYSTSQLIGACAGSVVFGVIMCVLVYLSIVFLKKLRRSQGSRSPTFVRMEDSA
ncbi:uncharacterized protein LOC144443514 [Glandiceps talaboti]